MHSIRNFIIEFASTIATAAAVIYLLYGIFYYARKAVRRARSKASQQAQRATQDDNVLPNTKTPQWAPGPDVVQGALPMTSDDATFFAWSQPDSPGQAMLIIEQRARVREVLTRCYDVGLRAAYDHHSYIRLTFSSLDELLDAMSTHAASALIARQPTPDGLDEVGRVTFNERFAQSKPSLVAAVLSTYINEGCTIDLVSDDFRTDHHSTVRDVMATVGKAANEEIYLEKYVDGGWHSAGTLRLCHALPKADVVVEYTPDLEHLVGPSANASNS